MSIHHKVVVIGSGPGGAIAALTLAEKGIPVTILEEGQHNLDLKMFSIEEVQHRYRNGGQTLLFGNPNINYGEGCCLGGGSEINSGLYHRTPKNILEKWSLTNFDESHFLYAEKLLSVNTQTQDSPPFSFKLHEGSNKMGWDNHVAPKWFIWDKAAKQSYRQSITVAILPKLIKLGTKIFDNTKVRKLKKKGPHWEIICDDKRYTAEHVILSAGAIQSPFILRNSGFKKGIGNTLTCHPTTKVVGKFKEKVNGLTYAVGPHQVKIPDSPFSLGSSVSLPAHLATLLKEQNDFHELMKEWEYMGVFYVMVPGKSKGTIRHLPFSHSPKASYKLDKDEIEQLMIGQHRLETLLKKAGCINTFPASLQTLMTIHLMGSIPLNGPINEYGILKESPNLLISDASILPSSLGVNPQGTIMALSRRNALHYYEEHLHG
tara:strand:- start:7013 stop:8308 length:1296 start_codon:yes stop_codon:yes gene_type:complete